MNARRGLLRAVACAALLGLLDAAAATPATGADPLRLATLAERIAKLHAQIAQGVLAERSRRGLSLALREFEQELSEMGRTAAGGEARDNFLLLRILWEEYRVWAMKPPSPEAAVKLGDRADEVAWIAEKGARLRRGAQGDLSKLAARAGLLSQRATRLHLLRRASARNEELAVRARAASIELASAVERLAREAQDPAVAAEIQVAETQLGFLVRAVREIEAQGWSATRAEVVAKTGDHILEAMTRAARGYHAAGL